MYKIKQIPEDFIVEEIADLDLDEKGEYSYFILKKKNWNTEEALKKTSGFFHIDRKKINACGNKDKIAVTTQHISVLNLQKRFRKDHDIGEITLEYLGQGKDRLNLGTHKRNMFIITVRDASDPKTCISKVPNLFGEQRFSRNNHKVGRAIVKKDFKKAVELILENDGSYEINMREFLANKQTDYIGALRIIPKKIITLFVHAYQSHLFNECVKDLNEENNIKIPLIGFGTDPNNKYVKEIIKKEELSTRDFIIRQLPDLSTEGDERSLYMDVNDFEIEKKEDCYVVSFSLGKGSYATVLIDYLFNS